LIVLRIRRPEMPRPFRMWLYPVPAVLVIVGFTYIVIKRPDSLKQIRYSAVILIAGLILYFVRAWRNHDWPFGEEAVPAPAEARAN
jgi:amino acid transporter